MLAISRIRDSCNVRRLAIILLSAGLISACSTNDVLTVNDTPPAPVGTGTAPMQPASQTPDATLAAARQSTVERQTLAPPPSAGGNVPASAASQTTLDATPGRGRAPSTFGAQASGLAPAPATTQQPQAPAPQTVSATTSAPTQTTATPVQTTAAPATQPVTQSAPARTSAVTTTSGGTTATIAAYDTVRFLPLIGAPADKLQPLSKRLGDAARASGLTITRMDDETASLSLKGYFSAVSQDDEVQVVYVWDVIGPEGSRLHRIQGSQSGPATAGASDTWESVTPDMMATIGQDTIATLITWIDSQN